MSQYPYQPPYQPPTPLPPGYSPGMPPPGGGPGGFRPGFPAPPPPGKVRRGVPWWGWVLILGGGLLVLSCGGVLGWVVYIGAVGPETKVYTANEVPRKFLTTIEGLNLLEPGEKLLYFYSDGLTDIRNGFYFVSDRKVVVYRQDAGSAPATVVPFARIQDAQIQRTDSFFEDSTITLVLDDGSEVAFPVSGELDRDMKFLSAIQKGMGKE